MRNNQDTFFENYIIDSKEYESTLTYSYKRVTGSFYTDFNLAYKMVKEMFNQIDCSKLINMKILEPCNGTGIFVFAILKYLLDNNYKSKDIVSIINNIYISEVNSDAKKFYIEHLKQFSVTILKNNLDNKYFDSHIFDYLNYDITNLNEEYIPLNKYTNIKFDIVITNPPYKNLKFDAKEYNNKDLSKKYKDYYSKISSDAKKRFFYASSGVINIYKLFVEEILCNYTSDDAIVNLLIPNTILSDKSCEKLRQYILDNHKIVSINTFDENNKYLDAQQALCTLLIQKNQKTTKILMRNNENKICKVDINLLLKVQNGNSIFKLNDYEEYILTKLSSFSKIKNLDFINNYRGELDLTLYKDEFGSTQTQYPLIRGRNICEYYELLDDIDFVNENFVEKTPKRNYIVNERIACQQISNISKEKRVQFAYIPKNHVLANSCNFISIEKNSYNIDIYYLLGLLNSNIINWFFKFFNSNNHISNYEIDEFPIPLEGNQIKKISSLTKKLLKDHDISKKIKINNLVEELFGINIQLTLDDYEALNKNVQIKDTIINDFYNDFHNLLPAITYNECLEVLKEQNTAENILFKYGIKDNFTREVIIGLIFKYQKVFKNEILNYTTFKLSDLDLEMIKNVPQGGNWKNIPIETVNKSERLKKIAKTGGRTTLYGRIDYNKPSYTITTYFNRPGNGTYVHPIHNRVISVREAARFQSFDDSYYFYGNKTSLLKQVGNAVPVLLGKAIGEQIIKKTGLNKSLDLFCGAGGLTSGFRKAGIKCVMGSDFDKSACITFKINNTQSNVLCADITNDETKSNIINYISKNNVDIICGGPPCQGFSLAGKRFIDDPRNQLFKHYICIVNKINPKLVIMENVEGLLTFQNGNIYNQIISLYKEMNYKVEGRLLNASEYGVPQKRKRVIIIAVRNDLQVDPSELFPIKTTTKTEDMVTANQAIKDLENIECSENAKYIFESYKNNKFLDYLLSEYKKAKE